MSEIINDLIEISKQIKNNSRFVIEICITDRLKKDYLVQEKYLILTNDTYKYLLINHRDLLKDIPIYISDTKFLNYFPVNNKPFVSILSKYLK